jgi:hypothetical protein
MLDGLAVGTEALDLTVLDAVAQKSRNLLRVPWARRKRDAEKPHDRVSASSGQGPGWTTGRTDDRPRWA